MLFFSCHSYIPCLACLEFALDWKNFVVFLPSLLGEGTGGHGLHLPPPAADERQRRSTSSQTILRTCLG